MNERPAEKIYQLRKRMNQISREIEALVFEITGMREIPTAVINGRMEKKSTCISMELGKKDIVTFR